MKHLVLTIGIVGILPLSFILRASPYLRDKFWFLIGVFPFVFPVFQFLDVEIVTGDMIWVGHVSGLLISAIDLMAIALYLTVRQKVNCIRYHFPFLLYLFAISLSVFQAEVPFAAIFYVWQFLRMYFFTIVIAKACTDERVPERLLKGLAIGLGIQFIAVLWQKFGLFVLQPTGTFVHQNTLGLITSLVAFPHFALLMAGQRQLKSAAAPFMSFVISCLIASRAALGFAVIGFAITFFISTVRQWTNWKALIGAAGIVAAAALAPTAYSSLERRFARAPLMEHEYDERAAFNRAALSMLSANPLGIGVNHYSYVGKNYGYSVRAGVAPNEGNLDSIVHNAYWLHAAEAGYLGLVAFIVLMFYPLWISWKYSWIARHDVKGDLLIGLGAGMLVIYIHSAFEYVIVVKEVQYILSIIVGITFGLAHQIAQADKARRTGFFAHARSWPRNAGHLLH